VEANRRTVFLIFFSSVNFDIGKYFAKKSGNLSNVFKYVKDYAFLYLSRMTRLYDYVFQHKKTVVSFTPPIIFPGCHPGNRENVS
jgi:hypothetical protein